VGYGATPAGGWNALQCGEVHQEVPAGYTRVNAEILRQVSQAGPQGCWLRQYIQPVEVDAAAVRQLQRCDGAHQRRFAGAVRAQQSEHAGVHLKGDVLERMHAIGVSLAEILDIEHAVLAHETVVVRLNLPAGDRGRGEKMMDGRGLV